MDNTEKDVKKDGASSATVTVDEKGVPLENRVKEYERKFQEAQARIAELEARQGQQEPVVEQSKEDAEAEKRRKIAEFVDDPDGFIERRLAQKEFQKEIPQAEGWLRSQQGFAKEDEARIAQIIGEHQLSQPSPMARAKAAWSILKAEKLEKEFSEVKREGSVGQSMLGGAGRSASKSDAPKRADLIAQLKTAQAKGDYMLSASILDKLEDVRE